MNDALQSFLANAAPTVASALLGPMAGVAVAGIGKIFGLDKATTKDITKAITEGKITPEQMAELKKLELQYKNEEAERGFKYAELEFKTHQLDAADRISARERETKVSDRINSNLAYLIVISFIVAVILILAGVVNINSVLAGTVIGYLSAKAEQVLAYYFGSSRGSKEKTDLLAQAQPIPSVSKE